MAITVYCCIAIYKVVSRILGGHHKLKLTATSRVVVVTGGTNTAILRRIITWITCAKPFTIASTMIVTQGFITDYNKQI
jgi:hypothetical protein